MTDIEDSTSRPYGFSLDDIWRQNFPDVPVVTGAGFGHGDSNYAFPLGLHARLTAAKDGVKLEAAA